ncbi:RNase A-like domain-containing protein [Streptomyces misionensis]|nr:RNase A-like domain-containing protein [Streptomyces misionensis]
MTIALSTTESMLTGYVSGITQQSNSEWYDAMRQFCSALWGTTAWGKNNPGGSPYQWQHDKASSPTATHPVMSVLFDSAEKISDLLRELAEAAVDLNHKVWNIYFDAVKQAVKSIDFSDGFDMEDVKAGVKTVGRLLGGLLEKGAEVGAEILLGRPPSAANDDLKLPVECAAPDGEDSGRSVTKQANNVNGDGFKNKGLDARAIPVKNVRTILKYDPSLTPPFVVLTSMPTP